MAMVERTVQTTVTNEDESQTIYKATYSHRFPASLDEAREMYPISYNSDGEPSDPVFDEFLKGYIITVDNAARNKLKALDNATMDDVQRSNAVAQFMSEWKYGMRAERKARSAVDPVDALAKKLEQGSEEDKIAAITAIAEKLGITLPTRRTASRV